MSKQTEETPRGLEKELLDEKKRRIEAEAERDMAKEANKRYTAQISKLKKKEGGIETTEKVEKETKDTSSIASSAAEHSHDPSEGEKAPKEPTGGLPPAPGVMEKASAEHIVKSWEPRYCPDKGCPTSGKKNPNFKDEVECSSCHIGLGAEANARENIGVCPNCGKGEATGGGWDYVRGFRPEKKVV